MKKKDQDVVNNKKLWVIVSGQGNSKKSLFPTHQAHRFLAEHAEYYGYQYSTRRNKILWFLCACYNVNPPKLQKKCDGCLQNFSVRNVISCSNIGLDLTRHNEIHDDIIHIYRQASPLIAYAKNPLIH